MMRENEVRGIAPNGLPAPGQSEGSPEEDRVLMHLGPGERFFKFYILSAPDADPRQRIEHRIITKEHADGSLEMVSYNTWRADGISAKRDVIRVPRLSKELLAELVERVRAQSHVPPESFREIDLSQCATVQDQLRLLSKTGI